MPKSKKITFGKSSFKKNLINTSGFQYGDLTSSAKKRFDKFMKKHKGKVKIEPTGQPGIKMTSI